MSKFLSFIERYRLWGGVLTIAVPLLLMLVIQFGWLTELRELQEFRSETELQLRLDQVADGVAYQFRQKAGKTLQLSASVFEGDADRAARYFRKSRFAGARTYFIARLVESTTGSSASFVPSNSGTAVPDDPLAGGSMAWEILFYDEENEEMTTRPWTSEKAAIYEAVNHFRGTLLNRQQTLEDAIQSDEHNLDEHILLNLISDDEGRALGIAGVVLNAEYLVNTVLPQVIEERIDEQLLSTDFVLMLRNQDRELVYSTEPRDLELRAGGTPRFVNSDIERTLPFAFTKWTLSLRLRETTPAQWAERGFLVNVGQLALIVIAIVAGIILVMSAARREMLLSQMKSDFVSNVSHELRTPVASIRVFGEFLRSGRVKQPEKIEEYGEYIETESRRLTQLINNILDFSKIESNCRNYEFRQCDLLEVVDSVIKTFEVRLKHEGFELRTQMPEDELPPVNIDRGAIRQVVHNLLDNAVKYSGDSRIVELSVERRRRWLILRVQDYGIGISPAEQQKIFERFHRVSTGLRHEVRGSGLGLAIVHHVAEAHGGRMEVESQVGEGSTFSLYIPVSVEQAARQLVDLSAEASTRASTG